MGILTRDDVGHAESLRRALMRAPDFAGGDTFGYDAVLGLVRGGNWDGGPKTGAVLLNAGLICGVALDYWNAKVGEPTNIEANVRQRLEAFGYDGEDKREIFFGECPPTVRGSSGQVYFDGGWYETAIYERARLPVGPYVEGPAIIQEMSSTTIVEPGQRLRVDGSGTMLIEV